MHSSTTNLLVFIALKIMQFETCSFSHQFLSISILSVSLKSKSLAMKVLFSFLLIIVVFSLNAQTPRVMHKRMGGTDENFYANLQNPNALIRQSNFGLPPTIFVKRAVIDSIIAINDSSVVVITSHQVVEEIQWTRYDYDSIEGTFVCPDSLIQKSLTFDSTGLWKPGRDLIVNHAVFNAKLSCDEILSVLRYQYNLYNSTQQTVFIGFDCSPKKKAKRGAWTWIGLPFPKDPNSWFGLVLAISLLYFILLKIKSLRAFKLV